MPSSSRMWRKRRSTKRCCHLAADNCVAEGGPRVGANAKSLRGSGALSVQMPLAAARCQNRATLAAAH
jgi:hypothetical protein